MTFHKHCILCHSTHLIDLPGFEKAYLCRCASCDLIFAKRIPSQEDLDRHYAGYGLNNYLSPLTIKRYNELLDQFESYRKTNRILDIGCGVGFFLEEAKKRGWEVYGTELSEISASVSEQKGIHIHRGKLDPVHYEPGWFDIVTSFEVIEHMNDPLTELQNVYRTLRNGGLVYITTPNFNSLLRYRLKAAYNVISYPDHLTYFTAETLKRAFNKVGFKRLRVQTTGISLTRFRISKGISTQKLISIKSDDEKIRRKMDTTWYLKIGKKFINRSLTILEKGDTLKGWFIKTA